MKRLLPFLLFLPLLVQAQSFAAPVKYAAGSRPYGLAVADFNNDGYADAVVAVFDANAVAVFLSQHTSAGTLAPLVYYPISSATGYNALIVATGDVNHDGFADIIATHTYNQVSVLINQGNGTFAPFVAYSLGSIAISAALADVNHDGYDDIVTANSLYYSTSTPGTVSVLRNNGNGTFATAVQYPVASPGALGGAAVGDVNGDGYPDIVATYNTGDQIGVLLNNGSGAFGAAQAYAAGTTSPGRIRLGDLNHDGYADVALLSGTQLYTLRNNGNGTFAAPVSYAVGANGGERLTALTVGDLNGDGYPEVVVGINGLTGNSQVGVLLNQRNGTLGTATRLAGSYSVDFAEIADVNLDRKPDILVVNLGEYKLDVRISQTTQLATLPGLPAAAQVSLAPNPLTGPATLLATNLPAAVHRLDATLTDMAGRVVTTLTLPVGQGTGQATLPALGLAPGLYLLGLTGRTAQGDAVGTLPTQRISVP